MREPMSEQINQKTGIKSFASNHEQSERKKFFTMFKESPIPEEELLGNLGLFINRQNLARILFIHELFQKIINLHGIIIEFGVRWGQNLALFESLRGIYEPYNYSRKIVGFDTFSGFPNTDQLKDGKLAKAGDYPVPKGYEETLKKILDYHESESPIAHKRKFELIKGDAVITIDQYLKKNPETIIALAYFDFDLYHPTRECLKKIKPRLGKGSIVAFDELNCSEFPGETLAFDEVLGISNYVINRDPLNPICAYIILQ